MKKLRTMLAMVLAMFMALTMAVGCSRNPDDGWNKGSDIELDVWIQPINQPEYFMGWFKQAFETANPGITLKFTPGNSLNSSLGTSLKSDSAPDITATWGGAVLPGLVDSNLLLDISDILNPLEDKFVEASLLNKVEGKHYGAPINGFASVIYYNKTIFDANGWLAPTTFDELATLCSKIKAKEYQTCVTGYSYHIPNTLHARTMTNSELHHIIEEDLTTSPLVGEGWANGWSLLGDLYKANFFATNISGYTAATAQGAFVNQNALMLWTPSIDLLALSDSATFEIGVFSLPDAPASLAKADSAYKQVSPVSGVYTDVLCINAETDYPEECKKVIEFMYTEDAQKELLNNLMFPVMKGIDDTEIYDGIKGVYNTGMKPIYDIITEKGMSIYYMSYYKYASGLDATLEQKFNEICAG